VNTDSFISQCKLFVAEKKAWFLNTYSSVMDDHLTTKMHLYNLHHNGDLSFFWLCLSYWSYEQNLTTYRQTYMAQQALRLSLADDTIVITTMCRRGRLLQVSDHRVACDHVVNAIRQTWTNIIFLDKLDQIGKTFFINLILAKVHLGGIATTVSSSGIVANLIQNKM